MRMHMGPRRHRLVKLAGRRAKTSVAHQPPSLSPRLLSKFHSVANAPWLGILGNRERQNNNVYYLFFKGKSQSVGLLAARFFAALSAPYP